jgi:hypothetical protein
LFGQEPPQCSLRSQALAASRENAIVGGGSRQVELFMGTLMEIRLVSLIALVLQLRKFGSMGLTGSLPIYM